MPSKEFLSKRKVGEIAQTYCAEMFRSWGLTVVETKRGYHPGYDLFVYGTLRGLEIRRLVEIKYDRMSADTGNIYLDIPSLSKSKASIVVYCFGDPIEEALIMEMKTVLAFAVEHRNVYQGGEWHEDGCKYPLAQFKALMHPQQLTTQAA